MATIKSFTDLQQSKKLAEILPLESADIYYPNRIDIKCQGAWSITALLSVLNFPSLTQNKEDEWEICVFDHDNDDYIRKRASNPVDACYEMIMRLHELKML